MLGKLINQILHENEDEVDSINHERLLKKYEPKNKVKNFSWKTAGLSLLIFLLAIGIRLYFLFGIDDPQNAHPGWYEDTYHHWQIAYLSLKIGFSQGFLRLWDLKGMEYFWGLLHPLILSTLMGITGSSSIIIARLLSLVSGGLNVLLIWLITKRYFGWQTGLAAALIVIFNPVGIFSDASGMQEPLGILMLLTGIYCWPNRPIRAGIFFMMGGMVRAEYWLISLGLITMSWFTRTHWETKFKTLTSYSLLMLLYMKYLLDKTGNAIYPMYWNFMGNMKGEWQANISATSQQLIIQKVYLAILVVIILMLVWLIWKKPKFSLFFSLGLGNWLVLAISLGLSKYLLSYLPRFWVDRVMVLPYMLVAVWLTALIFKIFNRKWLALAGWLLIVVVILFSQYAWKPIWFWRQTTLGQWEQKKQLAQIVAQYYREGHANGRADPTNGGAGLANKQADRILLFEDHPAMTYWLVNKLGIEGQNIVGQMFDPYYYIQGDAYANWDKNRVKVLDWLENENITLLVFFSTRERYAKLVQKEPANFELLTFDPRWNLYFYRVKY